MNSVYIISADAKDLYLSNYSNDNCKGYSASKNGELNTRRFVNTLDYSLDLIKLREVYSDVYGEGREFSVVRGKKEYSDQVVNVTFKYSVKLYNRFMDNVYVKIGYTPEDIQLKDNVCIINDELIAIRTEAKVKHRIDSEKLTKFFKYENGVYTTDKPIPVKITVAQLREKLYKDGFVCNGMKFCRFKRSSGSSRVGKCLFINEQLYGKMHQWELCGLDVKEGQEIDLAAFEAYIALTLSSIICTLRLEPENFLVIDDYTSVFQDDAIAVGVDNDGWLEASPKKVKVENCIWDGQSLIDISAMGEFSQFGMILLRNRFFKSACFRCNIQEFFKDHGITDVSQLNGFTLAKNIEDVKVITTPSSIKYLKFGTLQKWLEMLRESKDFGVVKHEKPTHFFDGRMVQAHYQLLNTLQMSEDEVEEFLKPSLDYLKMIRTDPAALRYHIRYSSISEEISAAYTANDVVYQMLGVTEKFSKTKLYYEFRTQVMLSFRKHLRRGHVLVHGNYSTLLGNPIEMLLSSIGKFDGTSQLGEGRIFTSRFPPDQVLLGSRSPHVTMGNVWVTKNTANAEIEKYINPTNEIVCVNSINENILMRLSGADFDSDTVMITDNPMLIAAAIKNYDKFHVPTSMVKAKKTVRHYTATEKADLDIKTSVNKIGEIINLSQELNTKLWDAINNGASFESVMPLYCDISKLDILSGIEIDKAKKEFVVDSIAEIKDMKQKYLSIDDSGRQIKPNFFGKIARMKGYYDSNRKNYKFHDTTMDYVQRVVNRFKADHSELRTVLPSESPGKNQMKKAKARSYTKSMFIPFSEILKPNTFKDEKVNYRHINSIIESVRNMRSIIKSCWAMAAKEGTMAYGQPLQWTEDPLSKEPRVIEANAREQCREFIASINLNNATAYKLLCEIESSKNSDISRSLFYMLFSLPNKSFLEYIQETREPISELYESDSGYMEIYGFRFSKRIIVPAGYEG